MIHFETTCQSALTKTGISVGDWGLNPYLGCAHGCVYCYARFMKRFADRPEPWGQFVGAKVNIVERLRAQLRRLRQPRVLVGTVTDAYQPVEGRYELTRGCLELLKEAEARVTILTKSALVVRDLELLRGWQDVGVGFSLATVDENARRRFEPGATPIAGRLEAMRRLHEAGVRTYVHLGPVLPGITDVEAIFKAVAGMSSHVEGESLNVRLADRRRVRSVIARHYPDRVGLYRAVFAGEVSYALEAAAQVRALGQRYGVPADLHVHGGRAEAAGGEPPVETRDDAGDQLSLWDEAE